MSNVQYQNTELFYKNIDIVHRIGTQPLIVKNILRTLGLTFDHSYSNYDLYSITII